jgi:ATP-binding cassette, subfamily A (ABC1), member 3
VNADFGGFNQYTKQGYSIMHNWVANTVLRVKSGNSLAAIALTFVPFKTDKYVQDDFQQIMTGMLPFFMLLVYILPMYRLISNVVSEKESKARESMKMMGLNDFSYWLSWWVYYLIIVTVISALVIIVLSFNVLKYSNRGLVFLFFWIYGLSLFGLAVFLQSFFSKARVAAITGTLVYFGSSFVNAAVGDPSVKMGSKSFATLLTTVGVSLGANNLAQFESSGIGLQANNMMTVYQNYSLSSCLIVMVISLFLFFFIGIWLDNVLPSAYGLRKGWCFCLTPSFWCRARRNAGPGRKSPRVDNSADPEKEAKFDTAYMADPTNFEPPPKEFNEKFGQNILKITDLKKTFENGFKAVQGINVKMYPG